MGPGSSSTESEFFLIENPATSEIQHKLQLVVKTAPGYAGKTVFVKAFDVDDSTGEKIDRTENSLNPVIDPNGKAGDDNRPDYLNTSLTGQFWTGSAWGNNKAEAVINADGEATFIFRVGMQPGNNYRVVASLNDESAYEGVQVTNPAASGYLGTDPYQTGGTPASPMLTVWRKIWVENDSMEAIPVDSFGYKRNDLSWNLNPPQILSVTSTSGGTSFGVPAITDCTSFGNLENGRIIIQSLSHPVIGTGGNTQYPTTSPPAFVGVSGNYSATPLYSGFRLYDDDEFGMNTTPLPRLDLVNDVLKTFFRPAFIELFDATAYNPRKFISFKINEDLSGSTLVNTTKDLTEQKALWVSHLTAAYQFNFLEDGDPNEELPTAGVTFPFPTNDHSVVFIEGCREIYRADFILEATHQSQLVGDKARKDLKNYILATVAHEMGHNPDQPTSDPDGALDHAEQGLMRENGATAISPEGDKFSARSLLRFRKTLNWSK